PQHRTFELRGYFRQKRCLGVAFCGTDQGNLFAGNNADHVETCRLAPLAFRIVRIEAKYFLRPEIVCRSWKVRYEIFRIQVVEFVLVVRKWFYEYIGERRGRVSNIRNRWQRPNDPSYPFVDSCDVIVVRRRVDRGMIALVVDDERL